MTDTENLVAIPSVTVTESPSLLPSPMPKYLLWQGDVESFLDALPEQPTFDLVITSPPYNLGKPYEKPIELQKYTEWQTRIITKTVSRLKPTGSVCWQVGNYVSNGAKKRSSVYPLDYLFNPIFEKQALTLRNRIVWHFGHGLHCKYRFSGRYEVLLWYTKADDYTFNLDGIRVPSKYPGKRHYKGPNVGQFSGNPKGKNPEDLWEFQPQELDSVWDIPNVKSNHIEKTLHPCQFPVSLAERLVLALTNSGEIVFDPFCGVASAGVAAALQARQFWGCELVQEYVSIGKQRVEDALAGKAKYRHRDKPIYDHMKSKLSHRPVEFDLR